MTATSAGNCDLTLLRWPLLQWWWALHNDYFSRHACPNKAFSEGNPLTCLLPSVREVMFPTFSVLISAMFSITRICLDSLSRRSLATNGVLLENTICWWRQMGREEKESLSQKKINLRRKQKPLKHLAPEEIQWQIHCREQWDLLNFKSFLSLGYFMVLVDRHCCLHL